MKTVTASVAALLIGASAAFAGGMAEPIEMAPVEIVEDTGGTSAGLVVPLILIALIAAAVASSD